MRNLYIQYYNNGISNRQKELDYCTKKNINNNLFDNVYILLEKEEDNFDWLNNNRTTIINLNKRITYRDVFEISNQRCDKNDINILCNLDMFFDNSLNLVYENIQDKDFYALSRWDINLETKTSKLFNVNCSQDTWIWKDKIDLNTIDGDYYLGTGGCDNAICGEFHENEYRVLNPSHTIKTHHLHTGEARHYHNKIEKRLYLLYPTKDFNNSRIKYWRG